MTNSEQILREIEKHGGMRHCEIIRFIVEKCYGRKYRGNVDRGVWGMNLYGSGRGYDRPGLLMYYCTKSADGYWELTEPIVGPFLYKRNCQNSNTLIKNLALRKARYENIVNIGHECYNCNLFINGYKSLCVDTPDKVACFRKYSRVCFAENNNTLCSKELSLRDCKGRLWQRNNKHCSFIRAKDKWELLEEFFEL
jgi:hypothetical protein